MQILSHFFNKTEEFEIELEAEIEMNLLLKSLQFEIQFQLQFFSSLNLSSFSYHPKYCQVRFWRLLLLGLLV